MSSNTTNDQPVMPGEPSLVVGMAPALPETSFNRAEPIPGYRTQERIGAGGYGEVWRAEAPGGIAKAIKIVYGCHNGERAQRELSALNRIKEVRHPFLLSLERIELVDGHLVIVAELATASLKQLFDEHRNAGRAGIPRDELLTHLRDAADALDYICEKHSLQHLDVKPENLLLVGGRVKVADFGLVKDLQEVQCSLMGGLTPVYAAPELFDGKPNVHSDQYSLAIVYQEMLTGMLPFSGRTTAQLAAQHLHSRPRLERLPAWDQPTIARALSKDPTQRFDSCREMVDCLLAAAPAHRARATHVSGQVGIPTTSEPIKTEMLSWDDASGNRPVRTSSRSARILPAAAPVCELPPLEVKSEAIEYRPTIFIGLGGLAARTLQLLERRLADRFGELRNLPSLQTVLFETDADTLKRVTDPSDPAALNNDAVTLLPLRQAGDYRRENGKAMKWLNRRWIFNIPRSLQTQGFRPLGRLALTDHTDRVIERIKKAIAKAIDAESLAASASSTGLPFRAGVPRVFIVSSISGGAGSGMVFDVAYLVRHVLREMRLSDQDVCGILAHCTSHNTQTQDIAVANSYAALTELSHYSNLRHGYPGDPESGLPEFDAQDAPFDHAYVLNLGENLDPQQFAAATDQLAAYLYCNSVTAAASFFDKCRELSRGGDGSASTDPTVRTFGLRPVGLEYDDVPTTAVVELCQMLMKRWREPEAVAQAEPQPTSLADPTKLLARQIDASTTGDQFKDQVLAHAASVGLADVDSLLVPLYDTVTEAIGTDPSTYLVKVLEELIGNGEPRRNLWRNRLPSSELIIDTLERILRSQPDQGAKGPSLEAAIEGHLEKLSDTRAAALHAWVVGLLASPQHRLTGAQRATDHLTQHLQQLNRQAAELLQKRRHDLADLEKTLRADDKASTSWIKFRGFGKRRRLSIDQRLAQYFHLRIEALMLNGVCRLVGMVLAHVSGLDDKLRNLAADLNRLAQGLQRLPTSQVGPIHPASESSEYVRELIAQTIAGQKTNLVAEIERELEAELLRMFKMDQAEVSFDLSQAMCRTAHTAILRTLKTASLREIAGGGAANAGDTRFMIEAGVKAATPKLSQCGGARRLLVLTPGGLPLGGLIAQAGHDAHEAPSVVVDGGNDLFLCYESEQLSLPHVAAALLDKRLEFIEVASRLQTRSDVAWSPL